MKRNGNYHPSTAKNLNAKRRKTAHFGFIDIPEEIKHEENDSQMAPILSSAQDSNLRKTQEQEHSNFESRSQNNKVSDLIHNEAQMN